MISLVTMFAVILIYIVISDGICLLIDRIINLESLIESSLFICVPICISTLLLIHLFKVYPFILYNNIMIIILSVVFLITHECAAMLIKGFFFKTCILVSVLSTLYFTFIIKKIFQRSYQIFQNKYNHEYYINKKNERFDLIMTLILNLILVAPTLIFIYIFF